MKKVVHVFTVSMSVVFLEDLYSKMKERGYELIVISSDGDEIREQEKKGNLKFYPVDINRGISPVKDLCALLKIILILWKEKPVIVHGHTPKGGLLGMLAAKCTNVKNRPYHLHGLKYEGEYGIRKKLIRLMEKFTMSLSTEVYSVSHSLRNHVIQEKLVPPDKIKVILNGSVKGIDIKKTQSIIKRGSDYYKKKLKINKFGCIIGFIGRITEEKGIIELIYATKKLIIQGYDIGVVICGINELKIVKNKQIFSKFIQLENVQYFGKVNNPLEYMACFDIFVLPSYREGFGLVNIEANSVGVPVVTTNIIGCIDSIEDNVTGIIINREDTDSLYKAIKKLIDNSSLRQNMGNEGIKRVQKLFDREKIWSTLLDEYDKMN